MGVIVSRVRRSAALQLGERRGRQRVDASRGVDVASCACCGLGRAARGAWDLRRARRSSAQAPHPRGGQGQRGMMSKKKNRETSSTHALLRVPVERAARPKARPL